MSDVVAEIAINAAPHMEASADVVVIHVTEKLVSDINQICEAISGRFPVENLMSMQYGGFAAHAYGFTDGVNRSEAPSVLPSVIVESDHEVLFGRHAGDGSEVLTSCYISANTIEDVLRWAKEADIKDRPFRVAYGNLDHEAYEAQTEAKEVGLEIDRAYWRY